ncbi:MAG TPA: sigma-70 family RNA polymerase sigma factor [Thermoanaerobaculia bacterium]|nr:sigma-70 family RNA polymerase sigma factor [Thermoanaerobaculia bacterium]
MILLRRLHPRLKALLAQYRIPHPDTEDLLQQALLALVYQHPNIQHPEAWLMGTLRNKCRLYWRERRRKLYETVDGALLEGLAGPQAPGQEETELRHDLANALERLPEHCRSLLSLRFSQGYEVPELAERLGYRPSSINKTTTRCIAALARYMVYLGPGGKKAEHD